MNQDIKNWLVKNPSALPAPGKKAIVRPAPLGPLPSLLVDDFDIHQIWEQINTRNKSHVGSKHK